MANPIRPDLRFALLRWHCRARKAWAGMRGTEGISDMARYIPVYRRIWEDAARRIEAGFTEIADAFWEIRHGGSVTWIHNYKVGIDDPVTLTVAGNKVLSFRLIREEGLSVPDYRCYRAGDRGRAERFMRESAHRLFVVKPANGTSGGRGVTTHIASITECRRASALASLYGEELIIERMVPGEAYRLLVLDGKVIHVSRRTGSRVTGDGASTIRILLEKLVGGRFGIASGRRDTVLKRDIDAVLAAQGRTMEDVPGPGETLLVTSRMTPVGRNVEVPTAYDEDATNMIGSDMRDQAVRAAKVIGSRFAGVDIITTDPAVPLDRSGGAINEINTTPGLHNHYNLDRSPEGSVPPAVPVLMYLLGIPSDLDSGMRPSMAKEGV